MLAGLALRVPKGRSLLESIVAAAGPLVAVFRRPRQALALLGDAAALTVAYVVALASSA